MTEKKKKECDFPLKWFLGLCFRNTTLICNLSVSACPCLTRREKKQTRTETGSFFFFFPLRLQEAFIILIASNIMNAGAI